MGGRPLDFVVIIAYLILMVLVGFWARAKTRGNKESFLVAERNLGFGMYFPCMCALILGGAATIGVTGTGFSSGIAGVGFPAMLGLGVVALSLIVIPRISKLRMLTVGEILGTRFNPTTAVLSAVFLVVYLVMLSVTQVIACGAIFHVLLGWDLTVSMIVGGVIAIAYSALGGMVAVTFTDVIQWVIMTVGIFFIVLPISLSQAGGFAGLHANLEPSYFNFGSLGYSRLITYFMLYFLGCFIDQSMYQRVFTARTTKIGIGGGVAAGFYSVLYGFVISFIGMAAAVILPNLGVVIESPQDVFGVLVLQLLPAGVSGFVFAGALSAMMSTISGPFLSASTIVVNDIMPLFSKNKEKFTDNATIKYNRIWMVVFAVIALIAAIWLRNILVALDFAYDILVGGIFVPFLAALFWDRATTKGAIASMLVSTVVVIVGLIILGITSWVPIIYGMIAGIVVIVIVSLLTPAEPNRLKAHVAEMDAKGVAHL